MSELSVNLVLGERLDLSSLPTSAPNANEEHVLRTTSGREIHAGLVVSRSTSPLDVPHQSLFLSSCFVRARNRTRGSSTISRPTRSSQTARTRVLSVSTVLFRSRLLPPRTRTKCIRLIRTFLRSATPQTPLVRARRGSMPTSRCVGTVLCVLPYADVDRSGRTGCE